MIGAFLSFLKHLQPLGRIFQMVSVHCCLGDSLLA